MTNQPGWHIKKEVSLAHIITTVSVIVGGLWWASDVKNDLVILHREDQILSERIVEGAKRVIEIRDENRILYGDIKNTLIRIEDKLDKKVDK